jgi:hypothetical protein
MKQTAIGIKWNACNTFVEQAEGNKPLGRLRYDGRIILKRI